MRRFIKNIVFFFALILVLAYPVDVAITKLLKSSKLAQGEYDIWNKVYSENFNPDLLVYGSSRAANHINPTILDSILACNSSNFGMVGQTFWNQYLRHKKHLTKNKPPKTIVLTVEELSFSKDKHMFNAEQLLPYMLYDADMYMYAHEYINFKSIDFVLPLTRYYGRESVLNELLLSKTGIKSKNEKFRFNGFFPHAGSWNNDLLNAQQKFEHIYVTLHEPSVELFKTFLEECAQKEIQVILVYTPFYISGQRYLKNRIAFDTTIANMADAYNLHYLNYAQDSMSYNQDYFYNSTHLNATGANAFSIKLANDLKAILIE